MKGGLSFAPSGESGSAELRLLSCPKDGKIFAEIEIGGEFLNRLLAMLDRFDWSRIEEPVGQSLLACAGARLAEQFEERTTAEDVEVAGVEMLFGEVLIA